MGMFAYFSDPYTGSERLGDQFTNREKSVPD